MQPLTVLPNLIDQVYDRLVDAIAAGDLKPRERIAQEEIAARLGVSRQPVSHALQMLKRQGLAIEHGRRGLCVAPIEADRMAELYEVRAALDETATRRAASAVRSGAVNARSLDAVRKALAAGQRLDPNEGIVGFISADVAFHSAIYRLSGNRAIGETVAGQWPHFKRCMGAVLEAAPMRRRVWEEHAGILTAIEAGDAERAGQLARMHTETAGGELVKRLRREADAA